MERTTLFETFEEFNQPCDSISFHWLSKESTFRIILKFSDIPCGTKYDLELTFDKIQAMKYEDGEPALIPIPDPPHCTNENFTEYIFPTLTVENSIWAKAYEFFRPIDLTHYVFVALNDIVHILSEEKPKLRILKLDD